MYVKAVARMDRIYAEMPQQTRIKATQTCQTDTTERTRITS